MFIDIHTHLLPTIDDKVKTIEETLYELNRYKRYDITHVIFTPHLNHPVVKTDITKIKEKYHEIKDIVEKNTGIQTYLASELYMTLNYKEFIPFNDTFAFVEFDKANFPFYTLDAIFNLQLDGYEVVLFHVEKYTWLMENRNTLKRLREMGVYFHMDFDGLNTKEGKFYLNHNMVDFLATGNHGRQGKEVDLNLFKQYSNITSKALDILLSPNPEQM